MKTNRSVPPVTVVPILAYPDVRAAVTWLSAAFGFVERTRIGERHRAQLSIGADGAVILAEGTDETSDACSRMHLTRVRVDDVSAFFAHACAHGAHVLEAPTEREYGERDCTLQDPAGHRWQFAETLRDVAPEEYGCTTVAAWPASPARLAGADGVGYVVRYLTVPERAAELPAVYPRHKAYLDDFEPAGDVLGIGTFEDPSSNGSMAIFATRESAKRFIVADPFVVEGLVVPSEPLAWSP